MRTVTPEYLEKWILAEQAKDRKIMQEALKHARERDDI